MKTELLDLRLMDCMELMKEYPDDHFDLAVTSPPYNLNLRVNSKKNGYCSRQIVKELSTKYANFSDNLPMKEYGDFLIKAVREMNRVAKISFLNIQLVTGNKPAIFRMMGEMCDQIKEVLIWDKGHAEPAIGEGVLNSCYEYLIVFGGDPVTRSFPSANFGRGTQDNILRIPKGRSKVSNHGASFPKALPDTVMRLFAKKGDSILDPFLGTGTTAIAAHYAGMNLTACEIDPDYFKAACERIERETAQLSFL